MLKGKHIYLLTWFPCYAPYAYFAPYTYWMARMRTGYPICVWAFGLLHTCMGVPYAYRSPYGIRATHTAYGRPIICVWGKAVTFFKEMLLTSYPGVDYSIKYSWFSSIIGKQYWWHACNQNLMTVTLTPFPCSDNLKPGLALNVWHQGVYRGIVNKTACGEHHYNFLAYSCSHYPLLEESSTRGTIYLRKLVQHQLTN